MTTTESAARPSLRTLRASIARDNLTAFWIIVVALLAAQSVGLIAYSYYLFSHFDLAEDFAHNAQAWFLIGHGNLSPLDTIRIPNTPFWRDHLDFILWPLGLIGRLWPSPFSLLVLQDLAVVAAEGITALWIARICVQHLEPGWKRSGAALAAVILLVTNPWWYEAVSFDFHMPPLGLPFILLTAYSLWSGRFRRAAVFAVVSVLFGVVVVELLAFVGLAGLLSRRVRRAGGTRVALLIGACAAVWVLAASAFGANQASNLASQFDYLAGSAHHVGTLHILTGVAAHPGHVISVLKARWHPIARILLSSGVVGVCSPWGGLLALGTVLPAALAQSPTFISLDTGFQTLPAVPFLVVGSVMMLARIGARTVASPNASASFARLRRLVAPRRRVIALGVAVVLLLAGLVQAGRLEGTIRQAWWKVSAPAASVLLKASHSIPPSAEVVASNGIIGRFAERRLAYPLELAPQEITGRTGEVYFVVTPNDGPESLTPTEAQKDITYMRDDLHARVVFDRSGVSVLEWHPVTSPDRITLP
jgi:uncharacterized membrane protein